VSCLSILSLNSLCLAILFLHNLLFLDAGDYSRYSWDSARSATVCRPVSSDQLHANFTSAHSLLDNSQEGGALPQNQSQDLTWKLNGETLCHRLVTVYLFVVMLWSWNHVLFLFSFFPSHPPQLSSNLKAKNRTLKPITPLKRKTRSS
jgi:hypothetical protein